MLSQNTERSIAMEDHLKFSKWLLNELDDRKMSQSDLSRIAGVTRATINGVVSGRRQPGAHLLAAISKALLIPLEDLYQKAGILPAKQNENFDRLNLLYSKLTDRERLDVLDYINYRLEKQDKGKREANLGIFNGVEEVKPCE